MQMIKIDERINEQKNKFGFDVDVIELLKENQNIQNLESFKHNKRNYVKMDIIDYETGMKLPICFNYESSNLDEYDNCINQLAKTILQNSNIETMQKMLYDIFNNVQIALLNTYNQDNKIFINVPFQAKYIANEKLLYDREQHKWFLPREYDYETINNIFEKLYPYLEKKETIFCDNFYLEKYKKKQNLDLERM